MDGARIGTAFVDVRADLTQAKAETTAFLSKFGKTGKAAAGVGAIAAAAGIATKALYEMGKEWDSAEDTIRTGTGKTGKQLRRLKKDLKAVVKTTPTDFGDASTAITDLNRRLGITGKPLRTLSKQFLELSRMTEEDLPGNIATVTRLFGDWGVKTKDQPKTLDKLFRASQQTGIGVAKLSDYMVQFGSPLRQLGFDFDTAAAMFSKFEKEGVNLQTAMPGLRMALKNFAAAGRDPANALQTTIRQIKGAGSAAEANTMAFDIFGTRAGPDLAAAIREGRFDFDKLIKSIRGGNDTIMKAGKQTRDFDENMQILGNKLKVLLAPAARVVFKALSDLSAAAAKVNFHKLADELGLTEKTMRDVGNVMRVVGKVMGVLWVASMKTAGNALKGMLGVVKGVTKTISSLLKGEFGEAWEGVKDIFKSGINQVIGFLNILVDALNQIPGLPDIGDIAEIGGSSGEASTGKPGGRNGGGNLGKTRPGAHQRGGPIDIGAPQGDSVPAMLERGEYVLNRKAADHIGRDRLDAINFKAAPRFSIGGTVGDFIKGGGAAGLAFRTAKGAIGALPSPSFGGPFADLGSYVIDKVKDFIANGFSSGKLGDSGGMGGLKGLWTKVMAEIARRKGWNLSDWRKLVMGESGGDPTAVNPSSGAFGLGQFLGSTLDAYRKYGAGSHDPAKQIFAMSKYIEDRYGNPTSAYRTWLSRSPHWYAAGGPVGGRARKLLASFTSMSGGEQVNSSIAGLVSAMLKRFDMDITAAYDPGGGHVSPGHNSTGTALDVVPADGNWGGAFEKGLGVLASLGFEVGYDGSVPGTESWPDHGRGNHAHIEMVGNGTAPDARKRLREFFADSGVSVAGREGKTEGEKTRAEAKTRKKQREGVLKKLRGLVGGAKTLPAKQSSLWKLLKFWGRVGMFDKGERGHILDLVQNASAAMTPENRVGILQRIANYAGNVGEITGRDPEDWKSFVDSIENAKERGDEERQRTVKKHERQRNRKKRKIEGRGEFAGLAEMLFGRQRAYEGASQSAERLVALEPEDLRDDYVGQERGAWGRVLDTVASWRDKVVFARNTAGYRVEVLQGEIQKIKELTGTAFQNQKWRLGPLREAVASGQAFIAERATDMEDFQGVGGPQTMLGSLGEGTPWWLTLGGPGARVFDTQNTIRELGLRVGELGGGEARDDSKRIATLEQLLRESNQRGLIQGVLESTRAQFERTYPYLGAFARGGVALVGERGPELVHMPEGTRVHSAQETAQLLRPEITIESLTVHADGTATMRYGGRDFDVAVKQTRPIGRPTPGGRGRR